MSSSQLLSLPPELLYRILELVLKDEDIWEMQYPMWTGTAGFQQPVFGVCRVLRDSALEVFYSVNRFVWFIDVENSARSDPADYPQRASNTRDSSLTAPLARPALNSVLPWHYPYSVRHLRHLRVNLYLPSSGELYPALRHRLARLVEVLDKGVRLASLHVLVASRFAGTPIPETPEARQALDILAQIQLRPQATVHFRTSPNVPMSLITGLNLERRMRAP